MVKEGLPDNPLEVIAAKLLAMAAPAGRPYPKAPRQPSRSVLPNPSLPNLSRTYPEAPPRPPHSSVLPNSAVCFLPFQLGCYAAGAPDPDKFFKQVDKVKAEQPDNLCAKYLEKVRQP